ncbi:MAG: S-layer protein RsaA [Rhodoferax sp.]
MAAATYFDTVQKIYIAYYQRPADPAGLRYWAQMVDAAGGNLTVVIDAFANSPEATALYGPINGTTIGTVIDAIYQALYNRAPDPAGKQFFVNGFNAGTFTAGTIALAILNGAQNDDAVAIQNKLQVANLFTATVDGRALTDPNFGQGSSFAATYDGTANPADVTNARAFLASVTFNPSTVQNSSQVTAFIQGSIADAGDSILGVTSGQTYTLTTGVDTVAGTSGNDTINAVIDNSTPATTFSALDSIDGGAGTDTLKISAIADFAIPSGATVTNVENVQIADVAKVGKFSEDGSGDLDLSTLFGGVSNLTVTSGSEADFEAATGTAVNLSGVTGGVEIVGGASQTVSLAAQGGDVKLSGTTGAVSFTSAKHGNNTVKIDGGSTVTVSTTSTVGNGDITIGSATPATGAVSVTSALNGDGTSGLGQGKITVTGGSTVTVNSSLTITAKDQLASSVHSFGNVTVTGDGKTTSVTVNQTYAETEYTKAAVAAVKETSVVTFSAMTAGQTLSINGLTFTASKNLTAAEVAAAFSNLTAADRQSVQGPVADGVFTGDFNTAVWTSGPASGAVVTFTAQDDDETDLSFTGTATAPTQVKTAGTAGSAAMTSSNTVTYGAVRVDDDLAASITTVNVNGYVSADLGKTGTDLNALTTLSLANSGGNADVATSATTLGLTVNNVQHAVNLDHTAATIKTLNVIATGKDSTFGLTAAAVEDLTVTGDKVLDIDTGSALTALKTVTVTGSAGLSIDATGLANQTSFNTTGTTGTVTATIDASKATYTGGAGVDNVTLSSTTVSKAISTGAGNDKVTLATGTTSLTANISAGDGADTLVMAAANAATASGSNVFETFIDGFEKLSLGQVATTANNSIDLSNMDDISYVISAGTADTAEVKTLTLTVGTAFVAGDKVSITINGTTYTTAALAGGETAADIATAIDTAVGAAYSVAAAMNVLTFTSATGGTTILSGLAVTGTGTVTGAEAETSSQLTLTKMADNGTLELTGAGVGATVTMTDATGTADSFNIVTKVDSSDLNFGIISVAGVETINLTATDISTSAISKATLALSDSAAKTVSVAGESDLALDLSSALAVTAVNAGSFTGKLTLTATGSAAMTVTGGAAADTLTASGSGDTLLGGAGNDVLTGADLTTLTGGAGNDIFMMNKPSNVNSYSTIADLTAGDVIDLDAANSGTVVFNKSAIVLAGTAVFQDYANAAINALGADGNDAAWFQYGGNTYIVQSGNTTAGNDFVNGSDSIIKITGLVDLSTASYNQTYGTLEIA